MTLRNDDWLTMVIDGMDQAETNIPRFAKEDRHTTGLPKIITHITGVMVYTGKGVREFAFLPKIITHITVVMVYIGKGVREFAFVDIGQFPHDSNLCVEVILRSLLLVKMDLKNKLFLQMDNCAIENKNNFICALAYLVETGVFEEVSRSLPYFPPDFLPVATNDGIP
ncbi:unnamed protein product [Darwinula stevensoni]|uniref:DUF7869 domain-containing protein n=1 Tax=Darwinula stevensoni TaxID=69355 RepID=A0A7R9FTB3_9CRUS|nr:unnamed protein product [Darwinula stevensoni]CAG0904914.1 unnamed protein product [Darwinula stevensoni]